MLREVVAVFLLMVVIDAVELNPCRSSFPTTEGWFKHTPVASLIETGAARNFVGCDEVLPRQCYLGNCVDTGCWLALPRTQGEKGTTYHVEAPYMTPCLHGIGRCVRGTCVEKEDAERYGASEEIWEIFDIPNIASVSSSFEGCSQHPDCLKLWNDNCSPIEDKPAHLGEELPSADCAPMWMLDWPGLTLVGIEYFAVDGMRCEGDKGECYGGRCFASDFPPYCPWGMHYKLCDLRVGCLLFETGENQLPGCSGYPPDKAIHFQR